MKNTGLRSPFARLGIFFGVLCLFCALLFAKPEPHKIIIRTSNSYEFVDADFQFEYDWTEHQTYARDADEELAAFEEWMEEETSGPCFEVALDESVVGYTDDYRTDLFNQQYIATQKDLLDRIETGLTTSFLDKTWEMDKDCFSGSFIVSFDVAADGTLGKNMLVHHIRGGSNNAGFAVMEVLWEMEREGHAWHDGTQGSGEVRIPIRFTLL